MNESEKLVISIPAHCSSAVTFELTASNNPLGVVIKNIDRDSAAFRAGLRCGDSIERINNSSISSCSEALELFSKAAECTDRVNVSITRRRDVNGTNENGIYAQTSSRSENAYSVLLSGKASSPPFVDYEADDYYDDENCPNSSSSLNVSLRDVNKSLDFFTKTSPSPFVSREEMPSKRTSTPQQFFSRIEFSPDHHFTDINKPRIIKKHAYGRPVSHKMPTPSNPSKLHHSAQDLKRDLTDELNHSADCMQDFVGSSTTRRSTIVTSPTHTTSRVKPVPRFHEMHTAPRIQYLHHHRRLKSSPKTRSGDASISAQVTAKTISTPTRELTVYKKKAISPNYQFLRNRTDDQMIDNTDMMLDISNGRPISYSYRSSEAGSEISLIQESSLQAVDGGNSSENSRAIMNAIPSCNAPSHKIISPRNNQRRSSEDLLMTKPLYSVQQKDFHKRHEVYSCCIKLIDFKTSEFEESHSICILPSDQDPTVKIERRMFSYKSDYAAPDIQFPLANAQLKLMPPLKLCLTHPDNGKQYYIMFKTDTLYRCWTAVFRAYIIPPVPVSPEPDTLKSNRRLLAKSLLPIGKNVFPKFSKKSSSTSTNPTSATTIHLKSCNGNQIAHSCTTMCVANSCLAKCTPSQKTECVPLLMDLIMDLLERFYPTVSGLYRVAGRRKVLDDAATALHKPIHEVDLNELDMFFSSPKDLANFLKILLRSFDPNFFGETIMEQFLRYTQVQPSSADYSDKDPPRTQYVAELRSADVEINAVAIRHALKNLRDGQLGNFDGEDTACIIAKEHPSVQQILIFYTLKRICRHIAILSKYESFQMQRLDVMGLSAMLAFNMHKSTDTEVTTLFNKLIAALSDQYEWYFEESLRVPSLCCGDGMSMELPSTNLARTNSEPILEVCLDEPDSYQNNPIDPDMPELSGDSFNEVQKQAFAYAKQIFNIAKAQSCNYEEQISNSQRGSNTSCGGPMEMKLHPVDYAISTAQEIDIDQAIGAALKEGRLQKFKESDIDLDSLSAEDKSEYALLCRVVENLFREALHNQALREHLDERLNYYKNSEKCDCPLRIDNAADQMLHYLDPNELNNRIHELLVGFKSSREDFVHEALADFQLLLVNKANGSSASSSYSSEPSPAFHDEVTQLNHAGMTARINRGHSRQPVQNDGRGKSPIP